MAIDARMAVFLSAIMPLVLGVVMTIYWHSRKTYRGYGFWVLSNFAIGVGYILLGFRDRIPNFFPIIVGNVLLVYSGVLIYDGIQLFFNRRAFDFWNHLVFGAYVLLQLYLLYLNPNINARIVLVSSVAFIIYLRTAETLLRDAPVELRRTCSIHRDHLYPLSSHLASERDVCFDSITTH